MKITSSISPLFTDLYEITMAAGYFANRIDGDATFSVYARGNASRGYFVAAGLADVVAALSGFHFSDDDIRHLAGTGRFSPAFLQYLAGLSFTGSVMAMAEGTVFFPEEPLIEITAPIIEAQLLETLVLNALGFPTLIATKAARCVLAAEGRPVFDFSMRRTHGVHAAMTVARSAYMAGFSGTSNVLAGKRYHIPLSGTMAHSFVTAFVSELAAFNAYAETFPDACVLLIDTYDVATGAHNAVRTATALRAQGKSLVGVRLDSGDLALQSIQVRRILDDAGFPEVQIFASNNLDEFAIAELLSRDARIDAFGIGTRMGVSADHPYLDIVYKLVRCDGRNVLKKSPGKETIAGAKQVFRRLDDNGMMAQDIIGCRTETIDGAIPLLRSVMEKGKPVAGQDPLGAIRARVANGLSILPTTVTSLTRPLHFPVSISERLKAKQP